MDFEQSERGRHFQRRVEDFMEERVYPAEQLVAEEMAASGDPHHYPVVMEELKGEARGRGLWNLFHPDPEVGPGLSNIEYAPLAEVMGRSAGIAPEAMNCNAPDTGNIEVLTDFGTDAHKETWLAPLLEGEIRSSFAMTEPAVASSDATNIETRIDRDGDSYVINGRKWWTTNALHPHTRVLIVMGKTNPDAPPHKQQSMLVMPIDTPGVNVLRGLTVFGYEDREGHAEIDFADVRVPTTALLGGEGDGFAIGQARLGPGRIHHCMRAIGAAERALELLCRRAGERVTFGSPLAERSNIGDWIAESRIDIEMARLLTMKAAWLIDRFGSRGARSEIAAIKVAAPGAALRVIDRAIQVHGGAGVSQDFPLAAMYAQQRCIRLADGPDEVHKRTIAKLELRRYQSESGLRKERRPVAAEVLDPSIDNELKETP